MSIESSPWLLSTSRVIIFSHLSLVLAGTKQPSQKSLPCSPWWLENDIKPDIVFPQCKERRRGKKEKKHKAATNEENGWGPEGERGAVASLTHTHKSWDTMPTHTVTDLKKKGKNPHRKHTKWMHYTLKKRQISTWYQGRNYQPWLESISQNTYIHIYQTQMKTTSAIWFFFRKHEEGPMPWNGNNSFQSHNWGEEKASRPPEEMENIK